MPLSHAPGHAQCDFGEALVVIGGVEQKAHCFVIDLPHSDGCFVKAYPAETTEAFLDGHVSAFSFLGGVPRSILYDNTRLAVAKILGDGRRQRTRAFTELQSHYLFDDRFGRPGKGKGNDKGKVEGLVGYVRRNFLVPIPSFANFEALNTYLEQRCLERMDAKLRGHSETIGQRMERELEALLSLPAVPYDACERQAGRVSSMPWSATKPARLGASAYRHRAVLVRGFVDEGGTTCGLGVIPTHPAPAGGATSFTSRSTYMPLLEEKGTPWATLPRCQVPAGDVPAMPISSASARWEQLSPAGGYASCGPMSERQGGLPRQTARRTRLTGSATLSLRSECG